MSKPLVTIITPVFNCEKYLEETIKSVLSQDYDAIQYIILDDGSTDKTSEIIANYEFDDRVFTERHENIGEARTVNKGYRMADGDLIAIVNADDPLLPFCISTMVRFYQQNPDILVFYPDWDMIGKNGELLRTMVTFPYSYKWMIRKHYCIPGPGAFITRRAIGLGGVRPEKYAMMSDFAHWINLGLYGEFMRVPYLLASFRRSPQQQSQAKARQIVRSHIDCYVDYFNRSDLPKDIAKIKSEAMSAAYFIAAEVSAIGGDYKQAFQYTAWSVCLYPPNFVTRIAPSSLRAMRERLIGRPLQAFHSRDTIVDHP